MRIVGLQEFLTLPQGTLFSFYNRSDSEGLYQFNGPTGENDFVYTPQIGIGIVDSHDSGETFELLERSESDTKYEIPTAGDNSERWGMHALDQLFLVYRRRDLMGLIQALRELPIDPPGSRPDMPALIAATSVEALRKFHARNGGPDPVEYRGYAELHGLSVRNAGHSVADAAWRMQNDAAFYNRSGLNITLYHILDPVEIPAEIKANGPDLLKYLSRTGPTGCLLPWAERVTYYAGAFWFVDEDGIGQLLRGKPNAPTPYIRNLDDDAQAVWETAQVNRLTSDTPSGG